MDVKVIEAAVVTVLKEVQDISGEDYSDLGSGDKPLGSLEGFDSLRGIETTIMVLERLGCESSRDSLFVSEDGKRATTLGEICAYLGQVTGGSSEAVA